jgi:hypothetical protein
MFKDNVVGDKMVTLCSISPKEVKSIYQLLSLSCPCDLLSSTECGHVSFLGLNSSDSFTACSVQSPAIIL